MTEVISISNGITMPGKASRIFQRLADQTGDPFWLHVQQNAVPIKISSSNHNPIIEMCANLPDRDAKPSYPLCKAVAYDIAWKASALGVKVVEGLVIDGDEVFQHAWINENGLHLDPVMQYSHSGFLKRAWKVGKQYFAIAEFMIKVDNIGIEIIPLVKQYWGINIDDMGEVFFMGKLVQDVVEKASSTIGRKGIWLVGSSELGGE